MKYRKLHSWNVNYDEAVQIQAGLRKRIILKNTLNILKNLLVAGADVSYDKKNDMHYAGVIVFDLLTMEIIEEVTASGKVSFPYIPGLLSFRESPILLKAFSKVKRGPDVIILDAQGIAHPRGVGLASHIGILLNKPTIGCAKKRLIGSHNEVREAAGCHTNLSIDGNAVGVVLRTKKKVRPVFVSPGHKIDLATSVDIILKCCRGYRIPEPTRQAHNLVSKIKHCIVSHNAPQKGVA